MAHEDLGKTSAMISGKTEEVKRAGGGVSSCYGNEEVRRSSASFISSVLLPATDSKQLQGMEGMSLSSYVKLMNLVCDNYLRYLICAFFITLMCYITIEAHACMCVCFLKFYILEENEL